MAWEIIVGFFIWLGIGFLSGFMWGAFVAAGRGE
jgi:hypothetical protein